MKTIIVMVCLVLLGASLPSAAHRFSTSFFVVSEVENHKNGFAWQWRLVKHDLETLVPSLSGEKGMNVDMRIAEFIGRSVSVNAECELKVLPMEQTEDVTYGGQSYIHINGHADCGLMELTELTVAEVFKEIDDHKVILTIEPDTKKHVLSKNNPNWPG